MPVLYQVVDGRVREFHADEAAVGVWEEAGWSTDEPAILESELPALPVTPDQGEPDLTEPTKEI